MEEKLKIAIKTLQDIADYSVRARTGDYDFQEAFKQVRFEAETALEAIKDKENENE